jgi:hypothetical protein
MTDMLIGFGIGVFVTFMWIALVTDSFVRHYEKDDTATYDEWMANRDHR